MPVKRGRDKDGPFFRWGTQHKYHYTPGDKTSMEEAKLAAKKQGIAIDIARGVIVTRRSSKRSRKGRSHTNSRKSRKGTRKSRGGRKSRR